MKAFRAMKDGWIIYKSVSGKGGGLLADEVTFNGVLHLGQLAKTKDQPETKVRVLFVDEDGGFD
jgi:hypothetical protein